MVLGRRNRLLTRFAASTLLIVSILVGIHGSLKANAVYGGTSTATCSVSQAQIVTNGVTENVETFTATSNTTTGNCSFTVPTGVYALDYLVVGGGGGGASGGGGAGQVVTSWTTRTTQNGVDISRLNPLFVSPGSALTVRVGAGGLGGYGGEVAWYYPFLRAATRGDTSTVGSVNAIGGGRGGGGASDLSACPSSNCTSNSTNTVGGSGGSSGGNAFDNTNSSTAATQSSIVGAKSYGNSGGASGNAGSGGYNAGGGGGGAGGVGGRNSSTRNNNGGNGGNNGGDGGAGIFSNITGAYLQYGCGGGGGVNANGTSLGTFADNTFNSTRYTLGYSGGNAGCSTAGSGSSFGISPYAPQNGDAGAISGSGCPVGSLAHSCFTGTQTTSGFGGGGGGTDPDSYGAGDGGSGVVVLRYLVPSDYCPPAAAPSSSQMPVACLQNMRVIAGGSSVSIDLRNYPSYSETVSASTTVETVTAIQGVALTLSSNILSAQVTSATSALIGGTYPLIYSLTTSGVTNSSQAYLLINVVDPAQHTPRKIPVDPRATYVDLPNVKVGTVAAVLMCLTPQAGTGSYANIPTVSLRPGNTNGSTTNDSPSTGALRMTGTNSAIQQNANFIRITKNSLDSRLLPSMTRSRIIDVNVSNTATGGNGSCTGGTSSTIELYPVNLSRGNSFKVQVKK